MSNVFTQKSHGKLYEEQIYDFVSHENSGCDKGMNQKKLYSSYWSFESKFLFYLHAGATKYDQQDKVLYLLHTLVNLMSLSRHSTFVSLTILPYY